MAIKFSLSPKPLFLIPDIKSIVKFANGDLGIGDTTKTNTIIKNVAQITTDEQLDIFKSLMKFGLQNSNDSYFKDGKYFEGVNLFLGKCFQQIGDEYSKDKNDSKKTGNTLSKFWQWFLAIPWYWKAIAIGLYVLLWIISPSLAWNLTVMLLTFGRSSGGSMGGGKFGGGGSKS